MSLYQFIHSRIAMGRMDASAVARANRLVRKLSREDGIMLCHPKHDTFDDPARTGKLSAQMVHFRDASSMVNMHHRHHLSPVGHLFSGGVFDGSIMVGAVIAGRPVARALDDGNTVELLRVVSDGTRNACSKVMGWAIAEARRRGYSKVITYTLDSESGGSLKAVGFSKVAITRGGTWDTPSRRRDPARHPTTPKQRWEFSINQRKKGAT